MNIKRYRKFNKRFFKIILFLIIFLGVLNFLVNPYNIFDEKTYPLCLKLKKPEAKIQERYTKFIGLKLDKRNIDTIFIGSSRPDWALNKNYFYNVTGRYAENLAMGGVLTKEYFDIYKELVKIHPEVKNIYIFIDFPMFLKSKGSTNNDGIAFGDGTRYKIPEKKYLTSNEIGFTLFSIQSSGNSLFTIFKNIAGIEKRMYLSNGTKHIYVNKEINKYFKDNLLKYKGSYENSEYNEDAIKLFQNLYDTFNQGGRNVYFAIMPTHISDQILIHEIKKDEYRKWKTQLTQITDVYDFLYPNEYNQEPIKPDMKYFFESSHATHLFGNIIIDFLTGNGDKCGHVLTKDNVKSYLNEDEKLLNEFIKNNAQFVKQVKDWGK